MIIYNKKTADQPINRQIIMYENTAKKWEKQIKNYDDRIANGDINADKLIIGRSFCIRKLNEVNEQLRHLRQFAEA